MADFPDYRNPPVTEVVLGAQFAPLEGFCGPLVGVYWATIRESFPRTEEHPPIAHMVEDLQVLRGVRSQEMKVGIARGPLPIRAWFISQDETQLLQVQSDRFHYNWRKRSDDQEYPRFPAIRDAYLGHWHGYRAFLEKEGIQEPQVDQCEVTYVNIIKQGEGWESFAEIGDLFTTLRWCTRTDFLPQPETLRWGAKFLLGDGLGRMHVELVPILKMPENETALRFTLTVRGLPSESPSDEGIRAWYEVAHEWIVKGFADMVDERTDSLWGKRA